MKKQWTRAAAWAMVAGASCSSHAAAPDADFPTRPIRMIVPFTSGGTSDLVTRLVGQDLALQFGQSVVIDNRAGAGATLGSDIVAKAIPDGYTLVGSNAASHAVAPSLYRKLPYDADRDFAHVALIGRTPQMLVVNKAVPAATLKEFLDDAKRRPGQINYGTAGIGSIGHFAAELLRSSTGIDIVHVAYKGTAPATTDLLANRVQAAFQNPPEAGPRIRAGQLKALAVTGQDRTALFPEVPTFVEQGVSGFVTYTWYGLSAPRGTPAGIVSKLNKATIAALAKPALGGRLADIGIETRPFTPQEFQAFVRADVTRFLDIARKANIRPES
jgi:tripartite-type tricarboxylate transporter receptor subunit TctC